MLAADGGGLVEGVGEVAERIKVVDVLWREKGIELPEEPGADEGLAGEKEAGLRWTCGAWAATGDFAMHEGACVTVAAASTVLIRPRGLGGGGKENCGEAVGAGGVGEGDDGEVGAEFFVGVIVVDGA